MAVLAAMAGGGSAPTTSQSPRPTNRKGQSCCTSKIAARFLPGDLMRGAKDRIERVYEVIGVRIVWVDSDEAVGDRRDGRLHLTVVLLSDEMARKKMSAERLDGNVVGQAHLVQRARVHLLRPHRPEVRPAEVFRDPARRRYRSRSRPSPAAGEQSFSDGHHAHRRGYACRARPEF